jgi:DNA methylase
MPSSKTLHLSRVTMTIATLRAQDDEPSSRDTARLPPTRAREITKDTPLETLNLDWTERELREKERTKHVHRLHPYLGKFIPQLVEVFLRKYFSAGQTVLEPFAGSGTTLVQANELGIHSVGFDVSAFNVLLCKAKLTKYDWVKAREEIFFAFDAVRSKALSSDQSDLFDQTREELPSVDNEYLQRWFSPRALLELLTYRKEIDRERYEYRDLLRVILSRAARSARLTTHFDLDFPKTPQLEAYWCFKHSRECSPTTSALKFLERYSVDTAKRIHEFDSIRSGASWSITHADVRHAEIPTADGIVTSPPYVGLIDYHEQHAYAYHLLGLADQRNNEIGAAAQGSSIKAKSQYKKDIAAVFKRMLPSVKPGGRLIVVAGDRANLYGDIADLVGVEVEAIVQRHVNRRTGRRASNFYESVFIWRKH